MNIYDALADAAAENEFKRFWYSIKDWLRVCVECGEREDWLMDDGSYICHACGAVSSQERSPS